MLDDNKTIVTPLVSAAFLQAFHQYPEQHKKWINISFKLGSKLPNSSLLQSMQDAGHLDLLLRCMEKELSENACSEDFYLFSHLLFLSELWIGHVYEIIRVTKERKLIPKSLDFEALAHDFRLLRIPIEKHEIAQDNQLRGELFLEKTPPKTSDRPQRYSKDDIKRGYKMVKRVSETGSAMWLTIDIKNQQSRWIERLSLSEKILTLNF
ncbi:MAG: hypothetical protein KDJ75_03565 [Alphaproteobacteria bacterium]|nr:hypothetical protein [Alphaproteobacteria bacterium]